jgi:hypothetical protein
MNYFLFLFSIIISVISCRNKLKETQYSASYEEIRNFLNEAKIQETDIIYFYIDTPKTSLPNVNCFNAGKKQLNSPPQCFQYIKEYVQFMNDSIMPLKNEGMMLDSFLKKNPMVNVYDSIIQPGRLTGYDYYLFIDFVAIPLASLQQTLYESKEAVNKSKKRIKLFLVHVISAHNKTKLKRSK